MINTVLHSARLADVVLALMLFEGISLAMVWLIFGRGVPPLSLATNLAAGACLVAALRAILNGGPPESAAYWLFGSFIAHVADVVVRWR